MKTIDISGFGGSYEEMCQRMLRRGVKFLEDNPDFDFSGYKQYKDIYGICIAESEDAKALDDAIMGGDDSPPTGAMHQAVVNHLAYIHKYGYDAWIEAAQKHGRRVYEIENNKKI